jgi:amino acid adenylation domain-containing protein
MKEAISFSEILMDRAQEFPAHTAFSFLEDGCNMSSTLTFGELDLAARSAAVSLSAHARPGSRAILVYPPGLEFIIAVFGCFYAQVIPVPVRCHKRTITGAGFNKILHQTQPACIVGLSDLFERNWLEGYTGATISHQQLIAGAAGQFAFNRHANDVALLQYTSGSTSSPKGVMISHANLIHNSKNIQQAFGLGRQNVSVSWLPHYHDMGLVDGILQPVFSGYSAYLFPATAFINRPISWLQIISRFKADHSGGPDFAYAHCVSNIIQAQCEGLDLSCWRSAYNGSEPIRQKTIEDFTNRFGAYGFKKHYFFPCYGLAESTLMISGTTMEEEPACMHVDRNALSKQRVVVCEPGSKASVPLVSSGRPCATHKLAIVDPVTFSQLGEGQVGEIWLAGESTAAGYWQNEHDTQKIFRAFTVPGGDGPFLRTGDLGFVQDSSLYVTGRIKDTIIIRGVNYYAPDIEETVRDCHPQIAGSNIAAFPLEFADKENLGIAVEVNRQFVNACDVHGISQRIRKIVAEHFEIELHLVLLLKPQGIPVTTSGKMKRYLCEQLLLSGDPHVLHFSYLYQGHSTSQPASLPQLHEWRRLSYTEKQAQIQSYLLSVLQSITGLALSANDANCPLVSIGLDSLQTTRLVNEVNSSLNCSFTITDVTEAGTIEALVHLLCQHAGANLPATNVQEQAPVNDGGALSAPASVGQGAQWFLHKLQAGQQVYNVCVALRLSGPLDEQYLHRAVALVMQRHHALRTVLAVADQQLLQMILPGAPNPVEWRDAQGLNGALLNQAIINEANEPFDLQAGSLFRVVGWRVGLQQHVLQLIAHHSIVDLYTAELVLKEIWQLYETYCKQQQPQLHAVRLQSAGFARWQHNYLQGAQAKASLSYWLQQLDGVPALRFPNVSGKLLSGGFAGATFTQTMHTRQAKKIRAFAAKAGVTPYVLLLAVYKLLLHRYCRAADFVVGSSITYRNRPQFENTAGYLVNQVALRARAGDDPTFHQFLQAVKKTVSDGIAHGDYPFAALIKQLSKGAERSEFPAFIQTMFNFECVAPHEGIKALALGVNGATLQVDELTISPVPYASPHAQFNIRLNCVEHSAGLTCAWEYRTGLFDPATASKLHEYFVNLANTAIEQPHLRLSKFNLIHPESQSIPINKANKAAPQQRPPLVTQMFEAQVRNAGHAIAISTASVQISYAELNRRANQLSRHLTGLGVGAEDVVGICLHRSPEMLIAMLAVWKSGAACLPLDPTLPSTRLAYMANNAQSKLVICQNPGRQQPAFNCNLLDLDVEHDAISRHAAGNPSLPVREDALAYVLYTSGSTGKPKGVMIEQAGLANYLSWCAEKYELSKGEGAVVSSSFAFDATLTCLLGPLVCGTSVILLPEANETAALIQLMHAGRDISLVKLTPSRLRLLESILEQQDSAPLFSVRSFIVGGEALLGRDLPFWLNYAPRLKIINEYGPTETVVGSTTFEISGTTPLNAAIPIGTPIFHTAVYVLDDHLQPVPPMVEGELYLGGIGVARGYINAPQQTTERFLPNPFMPGGRMFKTGDIAKYDGNGTLYYCGRRDDQVNIRGARIELAEVELAIRSFAFVADAVAAVRKLTDSQEALVAYIRLNGNAGKLDYLALRNDLLNLLPPYMIPTRFFTVNEFPTSASGKTDRQALNNLPLAQCIGISHLPETEEPLEKQLIAVWSEVLGRPVERHENFFDLGGDSLLAGILQNKLSAQLGLQVSMTDLFRYPTVALLALGLRGLATGSASNDDIRARVNRRRQALSTINKKTSGL